MSEELPKGWAQAPISRVAFVNPRHPRDLEDSLEVSFAPMACLSESSPTMERLTHRPLGQVRTGFTHFAEGDVLFAKITPCMENGKGAIAIGLKNDLGCGTTELHVLRPTAAIDANYLYHFSHQPSFRRSAEARFTGSAGQARVPVAFFDEAEIPIPPLAEQRRIVAKLEALLAKVDASRERLERIPVILKRFRQAVLAAACDGRLTEDWRRENEVEESASASIQRIQQCWAAAYQQACDEASRKGNRRPQRPRNNFTPVIQDAMDGIPETWCETRIGDIAECLDSMRVPVNQAERAMRQGNIPYYGANGQVGWIDQHLFNEPLVLVVEDETFVGREKPFSYVIEGKAWVNNHAHVLRPLGGMSVQYLNICLSYYNFTPLTSGTTGRRKLTQEALLEAPLLLAPPSEQVEIAKRVLDLLGLADQIEARYAKAKTQVDRLTQSILAKAFRGELVPQDPNDEPADVLLSRLGAAPTESSAPARRRGRPPRVQLVAPPVAPATPADDREIPALADLTPEAIRQAHREVLASIPSPLSEDNLLRAVALRLGFQRLGGRIKARIKESLSASSFPQGHR